LAPDNRLYNLPFLIFQEKRLVLIKNFIFLETKTEKFSF